MCMSFAHKKESKGCSLVSCEFSTTREEKATWYFLPTYTGCHLWTDRHSPFGKISKEKCPLARLCARVVCVRGAISWRGKCWKIFVCGKLIYGSVRSDLRLGPAGRNRHRNGKLLFPAASLEEGFFFWSKLKTIVDWIRKFRKFWKNFRFGSNEQQQDQISSRHGSLPATPTVNDWFLFHHCFLPSIINDQLNHWTEPDKKNTS